MKDLTNDDVAYCAEIPAGLARDQLCNTTFTKSLAIKNYYPSPEPGSDKLVSTTWNQLGNITFTKSLAEKNYYPFPEPESQMYSQISGGGGKEFVSATCDQYSIDYPLALLSTASLSGALIATSLLRSKKSDVKGQPSPASVTVPPSQTSQTSSIVPPPPPKGLPPPSNAPLLGKPGATSQPKRTPVSEKEAQRLIDRHKEITIDIQTRRAHMRSLEEKNKEACSKVSLVKDSIQGEIFASVQRLSCRIRKKSFLQEKCNAAKRLKKMATLSLSLIMRGP